MYFVAVSNWIEYLLLCWHLQVAYLALILEGEGDGASFSSCSQSSSHDSVVSAVARVDDMMEMWY